MKKSALMSVAAAVLLFVSFNTTSAFAEAEKNVDIIVQPTQTRHDRKVEAAAIEKAAEKIGDLRGSLEGNLLGKLISEEDLTQSPSNQPGFPIIDEKPVGSIAIPNAIPIV